MQTYNPIRGMTVCVSGGEYVKREDADTEIAALKNLVSVFNQRDGDKDTEIAALQERVRELEAERRDNAIVGQATMEEAYARIMELEADNARLRAALEKYQAFWEHSRAADRLSFEMYEWKALARKEGGDAK